jgi:membrane protein insertase Oxa1/YidC/SpoIIIJ
MAMWDMIVLNPAINVLLWLYGWLGQNYVLAIFVFTILLRLMLLPFTLQQRQQSNHSRSSSASSRR